MKKRTRPTPGNTEQMSWDDGAFKVVLGEVPDVSLFRLRGDFLPGEDSGALMANDEEDEKNPS